MPERTDEETASDEEDRTDDRTEVRSRRARDDRGPSDGHEDPRGDGHENGPGGDRDDLRADPTERDQRVRRVRGYARDWDEWHGRFEAASRSFSEAQAAIADAVARQEAAHGAADDPDDAEAQVRSVLDATPEWSRAVADAATRAGLGLVIARFDGDGEDAELVYVNGAAERLLGTARKDLIGTSPLEWLAADEQDRVRRLLTDRREDRMRTSFLETVVARPDGSEVPIEVGLSSGHYWGRPALVAFFRDVTERHAMEEALRVREERLRSIWDNTTVGLYRTTPDGEILDANPAMLDVLGVDSLDELKEMDIEEAFYPKDRTRAEWRAMVEDAGDVRGHGTTYLRRDGEVVHVRESVHVVRGDGGSVRWYEGTVEDVTAMVEARRELEDLTHELETSLSLRDATLNATQDGLLVVDDEGRIVDYNDRFQEMWRLPEEVLQARDDDEAIEYVLDQLKDPDAFAAKVRELYKDPEAESTDHLEFKDDRIFERYSRPQRLGGEVVGRVWSFRDVTEERRARRDLERSNEELQQFAHVLSHDLREPLRMVSNFVGLLEERYGGDLDDDADEFIAYAVDGAERMQAMIQGLLEYSRVETKGRPLAPTPLGDVVQEALDNLKMRIDEVGAEIAVPDDLPVVAGDRAQLDQLLQNLLDNALKYRSPDRAPRIEVTAKVAGDDGGAGGGGGPGTDAPTVTVCVADNGRGMDETTRERAFRIFQRGPQAAESGDGSGIGLAVCQRIVDRHGGEIWIESDEGEGTTVCFTLAGATGQDGNADGAPRPTG